MFNKKSKNFSLSYFKSDIPAAIVVWLVALPLCIGIAAGSGVNAFSGLIAPLLAWAGGSGLRGSFYGNNKQKIFGIIFGIILLVISTYWINKTGYWVFFFDFGLSGNLWVLVGFFIGLIFTTKDHYLNKFK